jgi:hypothetical protein
VREAEKWGINAVAEKLEIESTHDGEQGSKHATRMTPGRFLRKQKTIVRRRNPDRQGKDEEIESLEQLSPKCALPPHGSGGII